MPELSSDNIKAAFKIYNKLPNCKVSRDAITTFFNKNPLNTLLSSVLIKVVLIDSLYVTNLKIPVVMARHILSMPSLDNEIRNGNIEAVENIKKCGGRNLLAFASKYCHFHRKDKYPLYDRHVCLALRELRNWIELGDYESFFNEMNKLKIESGCRDFEELDIFLWLYGQREELRRGERKISKEVKELYLKEMALFDSLG